MKHSHFLQISAGLLLALAGLPGVARAEWTGLLVPAYFGASQTAEWTRLANGAAAAPVIAIANVANGPGSQARPDVRAVLSQVRAAGGRVVGYVHTTYTRRDLETVKADVDRWASFYALDGIFVDEMTNDGAAAGLAYFRALRDHARSQRPDWIVIGNPGTTTREPYLTQGAADVLVTFENHAGYGTYLPDPWTRRHPPTAFAHLCYGVATAETMVGFLDLARTRRAGWIYVTDDVLNNPWDRLPTYWEQEVEAARVRNAGEPVRLSVVGAAAGSVSLRVESIPGRHTIEASADLVRWETLHTAGAPTGVAEVTLTTAGTGHRYFRARR